MLDHSRGHSWMTIVVCLLLLVSLLGCGCAGPALPGPTTPPEALPTVPGLTELEVTALASLTKVDDHPLYTMRTTMDHTVSDRVIPQTIANADFVASWACSLFAALGSVDASFYGRNFDWDHSPALMLFADPPDGFASVSMVDIAYLVPEDKLDHLTELPLAERTELLDAPLWPFDGMNEHGLVVGMAAVPVSQVLEKPGRDWIGSLGIIREMLDHARDVEQALEVMARYNISMEGGPQIHYLLADASGRAVLVELYEGEFRQVPNSDPWHAATNFTLSAVKGDRTGTCWRYDALIRKLEETDGKLTQAQSLDLLSAVSQAGTQWSIVYGISTGSISIAMGRDYSRAHIFWLSK